MTIDEKPQKFMNSVVFLNYPEIRILIEIISAYIQEYFINQGTVNEPCAQGALLQALSQLSVL